LMGMLVEDVPTSRIISYSVCRAREQS